MKSRIVCIIQFNNQYTFQECVNSPKLTNEPRFIKINYYPLNKMIEIKKNIKKILII